MTCGKRLVDGGAFGRSVHHGRWHGDVVVHVFSGTGDPAVRRRFLRQVRALTQVRHENLVLYMGAAAVDGGGRFSIVTNPVRAESLHSRYVDTNSYLAQILWKFKLFKC